jgi:hypothetical protein
MKMIVDEKSRSQLLKEVLGRANKLEKQEHEKISKMQSIIAEKNSAMLTKWNELSERSKINECPKETAESKNHKPVKDMSMEEFNRWSEANNKHFEASFAFCNKSIEINTERIGVIKEILESVIELWSLCNEEKWLLLSIALRSQPNLLKYLK